MTGRNRELVPDSRSMVRGRALTTNSSNNPNTIPQALKGVVWNDPPSPPPLPGTVQQV